jgi:hypothetical protein
MQERRARDYRSSSPDYAFPQNDFVSLKKLATHSTLFDETIQYRAFWNRDHHELDKDVTVKARAETFRITFVLAATTENV